MSNLYNIAFKILLDCFDHKKSTLDELSIGQTPLIRIFGVKDVCGIIAKYVGFEIYKLRCVCKYFHELIMQNSCILYICEDLSRGVNLKNRGLVNKILLDADIPIIGLMLSLNCDLAENVIQIMFQRLIRANNIDEYFTIPELANCKSTITHIFNLVNHSERQFDTNMVLAYLSYYKAWRFLSNNSRDRIIKCIKEWSMEKILTKCHFYKTFSTFLICNKVCDIEFYSIDEIDAEYIRTFGQETLDMFLRQFTLANKLHHVKILVEFGAQFHSAE